MTSTSVPSAALPHSTPTNAATPNPAYRETQGSAVWMWLAIFGSLLGTLSLPWDIANHIENIRDAVLYPAHLGLLAGLGTWAVAGALSVITRPVGAPLRSRRGGLLCAVGASTAFATFPLDAGWHELFGIDVTLWGPTHLVMMLGGSIASLGVFTMVVDHTRGRTGVARVGAMLAGAFPLSAMLAYLLEYAFDVPQFSLLYPTLLSSLAIGLSLVAVRVALGRGAALVATVGFLVLSVGLVGNWLVTLGYNPTHIRLMLPAAVLIEAAFLFAPRRHAAWISGLLVGSLGVLGEWVWNVATVDGYPRGAIMHVWWVWPASMAIGVIAAFGGAGIGNAISRPFGAAPEMDTPTRRHDVSRMRFIVGTLAIIAILLLPIATSNDATIKVTSSPTNPAGAKTTFTFSIAEQDMKDVESAAVVSGHGGDLLVNELEHIQGNIWRTTEPSPVTGTWFTSLRLMRANEILGIPLRAPGGSIYGTEVKLEASTRVADRIQAVPVAGHSPIIPILAYLVVALTGVAALALTRFALGEPRAARGTAPISA